MIAHQSFGRNLSLAALGSLAWLTAGGILRAQSSDNFAWQYSSPEEQGVDSTQLARMYAQVQRDGLAVHSFLLVRHDRIVAEAYVYPYDANVLHPMYSVSKSFTSSLVGIAIDRGLIAGVDERVVDVFRGVTTQPLAGNVTRMTLRHLLTMSTGHATDTTPRITGTLNWEKAFLELPVENEPGSLFVYNSGGSYMLASAVQRRVGMTAAAFAQQVLFGPLGITSYSWDTSPTNVIAGGWGLSLRPLDMARFGLMYLHQGRWNGRQVVPAAWVEQASRKQMDNGTAGFWGSGYGYQFWMNDFGGYRADGAFGQFIFILPDQDMVAVFTNNLASDTEVIARLMRQYVLPAVSPGPRRANPRGDALLERVAGVVAAGGATAAPTFTRLPESQTVSAGAPATFTVTAIGTPVPTCQWYKDELPLAGATSPTLTLAGVTAADAGEYVAVARNSVGATATYPVTLAVLGPPAILSQPVAVTVGEGGEAAFTVAAAGGGLAYEWRRDGAAIPTATDATLRLSGVTSADSGQYTVVVRNAQGSAISEPARLTVGAADRSARLVNLSVRSSAGTGDRTLIVGLVVAGPDRTSGLPVLLRGIGPSLSSLGVGSGLADPAVVLYAGGTPVATNSDWRGAALLADTMQQAGAFALPAGSADAAVRSVLLPRTYTMHVTSSLPDRTGVALAECYDASGISTAGAPRLVNVSARSLAGSGEDTLIAGFVVSGTGTLRLLIRGIGPTLASQSVSGALADPELRLFSAAGVIAANDDWSGDPALRTAFVQAGAFDLPADSRDAALLVTLPAGVYTAQVTGKAGATGIALVEVYVVQN